MQRSVPPLAVAGQSVLAERHASRGQSRKFNRFLAIGQACTARGYRQWPLPQYTIRIVDSGQIRESLDWSAFVSLHVVVFDA